MLLVARWPIHCSKPQRDINDSPGALTLSSKLWAVHGRSCSAGLDHNELRLLMEETELLDNGDRTRRLLFVPTVPPAASSGKGGEYDRRKD